MGCLWSSELEEDQCMHCTRRAVNNLIVINNECECCLSRQKYLRERNLQLPQFGEYQCSCGRKWVSRRSWHDSYQICIRCRRHVYAHTQRPLRPNDISRDRENVQDHPQELCQKCIEVGYYCGKHKFWHIRKLCMEGFTISDGNYLC